YKPVSKRKRPIAVTLPHLRREPYKPIPEPIIPKLPHHPPNWKEFAYTKKLTPERVKQLVDSVTPGFLSEEELSLLIWVVGQNEDALAWDDSERGTFKPQYFPDYIMETVEHVPWQEAPIRIPEAIKEETIDMLRQQIANGNLEPAQASYRARVFVVLKPKG
ncbi:hypothetical protein DL93DRAFT_2033518, partial [Clavulina sp. PMI_390]